MSRRRLSTTALRAGFTLLTACVIAAIIVQDHTRYLPLGIFNTGAATMRKIADACLAATTLALIVQIIELFTGRLSRLAGIVRGAYVSVAILDVLLIFADRWFITGDPDKRPGQYYEVAHSGDPPVILKKDFGNHHTFLPCFMDATTSDAGPRVLFLGDSYTEGSGSSPACNYPDVVENVLREKWRRDAHVVRAGVSGYGPVEALSLLRWYRAHGCPVRAVVYNLTLQNDFSDNLPRTERRVVAGFIFRFPKNAFLRTFHPLNTRAFRWALVLTYFGKASTHDMLRAVSRPGGPCDLTPKPLTEVSPFLRASVGRDLDNARRVAQYGTSYDEGLRAIRTMRIIATEMHVPFFVIVFPDRVLADVEVQKLLGSPDLAASAQAHALALQLKASRVIDVYGMLVGKSGMYRDVDTHLSDAGNIVAGEYVGTALAEDLATARGSVQWIIR